MDIILAQFKGGISAKRYCLGFLAVHTKRIKERERLASLRCFQREGLLRV